MKETKKEKGLKFDQAKDRWDLLPYVEVEEIVKVLTFGAQKYAAWNFSKVDDWKNRYFAALMRHLTAYWAGETIDPESGLSHLSHAGCCLLFLMYKENNNE